MTESWEEKTERLEREYQARIDRLREELRNTDKQRLHMESLFEERVRQHEQIEYTNAALKKRVAELEVSVETNKHWFAHAWNCRDRIQVLERLTDHLQSQLEVKDKRVAELEHEAMMLRGSIAARDEISERHLRVREELAQQVLDLQSQLAWTPVSAGLPTEPGVDEFYDANGRYMLGVYELTPSGRWLSFDGDTWVVVEFEDYTSKLYTHYRRIELPKDGET